jgi:pyrophosphatase PpaX
MKLQDYDAYLFDWDGTLARTLDGWLQGIRDLLDLYGIKASDKDIVFKMLGRIDKGVRELGISDEDFPRFMRDIKARAPQIVAGATLYDDVPALLKTLKANGKKLALVTASLREIVDIVITQHGLLDYFDVVVSGDDITEHKPDPEGIHKALQTLGVDASRAVMLGDSDKDLRAATNAGTDSVLFFPAGHEVFHTREQLETYHPTFTLANWHELIREFA